ncbi:MAG TPA: hypothetical protein DCX37_07160 [Firmicutes bacterium]|nr:hypothetical protein [Bacillota bacterium]
MVDFILNNPEYSTGVFQILFAFVEPQQYSEAKLRSSFAYRFGPKLELGSILPDLMRAFYNTSKEDLSNRRGSFLEELIERVGPVTSKPFLNKWLECNIFYQKRLIWDLEYDFDVLFEFSPTDIEAHECKANLVNYLRGNESQGKIEFMANVVQFYKDNGWQCVAYVPTLCLNPFPQFTRLLENAGLTVLLRDKLSALVAETA